MPDAPAADPLPSESKDLEAEAARLASRMGGFGLEQKIWQVLRLFRLVREKVMMPDAERGMIELKGAEHALFNSGNPARMNHLASSLRYILEMLLKWHVPDDMALSLVPRRGRSGGSRPFKRDIPLPDRAFSLVLRNYRPSGKRPADRERAQELIAWRRFIDPLNSARHTPRVGVARRWSSGEVLEFAINGLELIYKVPNYKRPDNLVELDKIRTEAAARRGVILDSEEQELAALRIALGVALKIPADSSLDDALAIIARSKGIGVSEVRKIRENNIRSSSVSNHFDGAYHSFDEGRAAVVEVFDACSDEVAKQLGGKDIESLSIDIQVYFYNLLLDDITWPHFNEDKHNLRVVEIADDYIVAEGWVRAELPMRKSKADESGEWSLDEDNPESRLVFECTARARFDLFWRLCGPGGGLDPRGVISPVLGSRGREKNKNWEVVSVRRVDAKPAEESLPAPTTRPPGRCAGAAALARAGRPGP